MRPTGKACFSAGRSAAREYAVWTALRSSRERALGTWTIGSPPQAASHSSGRTIDITKSNRKPLCLQCASQRLREATDLFGANERSQGRVITRGSMRVRRPWVVDRARRVAAEFIVAGRAEPLKAWRASPSGPGDGSRGAHLGAQRCASLVSEGRDPGSYPHGTQPRDAAPP